MIHWRRLCRGMAWLTLLLSSGPALVMQAAPTIPNTPEKLVVTEIETILTTESGHEFPLLIFAPDRSGTFPLIVFSTGAFSSPDRYLNMLQPIAEAGYVILAPTHLDAEILALDPKPKSETVWKTRNDEIAHLAAVPERVVALLKKRGIDIDAGQIAAMGHSYGALIAQIGAGAIATEPDGSRPNRKIDKVAALVAYSPPGPVAEMIDAKGWSTIDVPSLTVTGTADILPGFIDDWRLHKAAYEATPEGARWLWVGDDVDHYFDGLFGRGGSIRPEIAKRFDHSIATTIQFLDLHLKPEQVSTGPEPLSGVQVTKD